MGIDKNSLGSLFKGTGAKGGLGLDEQSSAGFIQNLNANTVTFAQQSPFTPEENETDDAHYMMFVFDASGSMDGVADELRDGVNEILIPALLGGAKDQVGALRIGGISFDYGTKPMWGGGFKPIAALPNLTKKDYSPSGATALNKAVIEGATAAVAAALEWRRKTGSNPQVTIVCLSDGANNQAPDDAGEVLKLLEPLSSELFSLVFIGFETQERVDFRQIAKDMGFRDIQSLKRQAGEDDAALKKRFRNMMKVFSQQMVGHHQSRSTIKPPAQADGSSGFFTNPVPKP